jgi:hypothetical protein
MRSQDSNEFRVQRARVKASECLEQFCDRNVKSNLFGIAWIGFYAADEAAQMSRT